MTTQHTPEPWRAYDLESSTPHIGTIGPAGRGWLYETVADFYHDTDDSTSVVGAIYEPHPNAAANARRIVACINACAGIPIEELEGAQFAKLDGDPLYELVRG